MTSPKSRTSQTRKPKSCSLDELLFAIDAGLAVCTLRPFRDERFSDLFEAGFKVLKIATDLQERLIQKPEIPTAMLACIHSEVSPLIAQPAIENLERRQKSDPVARAYLRGLKLKVSTDFRSRVLRTERPSWTLLHDTFEKERKLVNLLLDSPVPEEISLMIEEDSRRKIEYVVNVDPDMPEAELQQILMYSLDVLQNNELLRLKRRLGRKKSQLARTLYKVRQIKWFTAGMIDYMALENRLTTEQQIRCAEFNREKKGDILIYPVRRLGINGMSDREAAEYLLELLKPRGLTEMPHLVFKLQMLADRYK